MSDPFPSRSVFGGTKPNKTSNVRVSCPPSTVSSEVVMFIKTKYHNTNHTKQDILNSPTIAIIKPTTDNHIMPNPMSKPQQTVPSLPKRHSGRDSPAPFTPFRKYESGGDSSVHLVA